MNTPKQWGQARESSEAMKKWQEGYEALEKEREQFAKEESTGFVWLFRGK